MNPMGERGRVLVGGFDILKNSPQIVFDQPNRCYIVSRVLSIFGVLDVIVDVAIYAGCSGHSHKPVGLTDLDLLKHTSDSTVIPPEPFGAYSRCAAIAVVVMHIFVAQRLGGRSSSRRYCRLLVV